MRVITVPVKSLSKAKTRLARILSPIERAALTLAMLEDVLDAALAVPEWETWVISPDEAVLEVAAQRRARPVAEEKPGLVREAPPRRGVAGLAGSRWCGAQSSRRTWTRQRTSSRS